MQRTTSSARRSARISSRLFALLVATLLLGNTTRLLRPVLALLALLSAGLLDLGGLAVTDEPVVGLELLHRLGAVVDEGEASGLATTVLGAETEDGDLVLVGLVELGELGAELILGDVGTVGVEDVNDHLLAAQKGVANELARAQSHLRVRHDDGWLSWIEVVGQGLRLSEHSVEDRRRVSAMTSKVEEEEASSKSKGKKEFLSRIKMAAGFTPSSSDKGKGRSKLQNKGVIHGFHLVKGKSRHDMEDYYVAEFKRLKDHDLGLYAIFDGHLGHKVPSYLQSNLFDNILNEPGFWTEPEKAIKSAYRRTDGKILAQTADLGPGGSTAVTAILIDGKKLFVANVGDSRAVLCQGGNAIQLTVDHEPSMERQNIEKKGGFVTNLPGDVPRVNGQLAVARAFGDGSLKQHLSSEPDVIEKNVDAATEFLILASDGLWKVMKNQEAVDLIRKIKDPQVAAKCLTEQAVSRKSKDDISCIVVRFQ